MKLSAMLSGKRCSECGMYKEPNRELCVLCTAIDNLREFVQGSESRRVNQMAADLINRDLQILETWAPPSQSQPAPPPEVSVVPPKRPAPTSSGSTTSSGGQPRPPQPSGSVTGRIPVLSDFPILGHVAWSGPSTWAPEAQDDVAPSNG